MFIHLYVSAVLEAEEKLGNAVGSKFYHENYLF